MAKGKRGFQPGNACGKAFSSHYQPKKNGRKPVLYTKILQNLSNKEDSELSKEDYFKVIRYLMERTPGELKKILNDAQNNPNSTLPIWIANLISAIFSDIRKGRMNILNILFDRLFGKSGVCIEFQQDIYQVNSHINIQSVNLIEEEIKQLDEILNKISISNNSNESNERNKKGKN